MINTSISGMILSSSHILCLYDLTLPFKIANKACSNTSAVKSRNLSIRLHMLEYDFQTAGGSRGPHQGDKQDYKQKRNPPTRYNGSFKMRIQLYNVKSTVVTESG